MEVDAAASRYSLPLEEKPVISPGDRVILVVGGTGTGKSSVSLTTDFWGVPTYPLGS